jgi:hypothetical protein
MSRFGFGDHGCTVPVAATASIRPFGNPASAVAVLTLAVVAGVGTARYVAVTDSYLTIQYAVPTYAGSVGAWFYGGGGLLLALAAASALLGAGLVPAIAVAGAPVAGWAVNHFSSPITPHYAGTFPIEMALLYGGLFGTAGYLLGRALGDGMRRVASARRHHRDG